MDNSQIIADYDILIQEASKIKKMEYRNFLLAQMKEKEEQRDLEKRRKLEEDILMEKRYQQQSKLEMEQDERERIKRQGNNINANVQPTNQMSMYNNFSIKNPTQSKPQVVMEKRILEEESKREDAQSQIIEEDDSSIRDFNDKSREEVAVNKEILKDEFILRFFTEQTRLCCEYKAYLEDLLKDKEEARKNYHLTRLEFDQLEQLLSNHNTYLEQPVGNLNNNPIMLQQNLSNINQWEFEKKIEAFINNKLSKLQYQGGVPIHSTAETRSKRMGNTTIAHGSKNDSIHSSHLTFDYEKPKHARLNTNNNAINLNTGNFTKKINEELSISSEISHSNINKSNKQRKESISKIFSEDDRRNRDSDHNNQTHKLLDYPENKFVTRKQFSDPLAKSNLQQDYDNMPIKQTLTINKPPRSDELISNPKLPLKQNSYNRVSNAPYAAKEVGNNANKFTRIKEVNILEEFESPIPDKKGNREVDYNNIEYFIPEVRKKNDRIDQQALNKYSSMKSEISNDAIIRDYDVVNKALDYSRLIYEAKPGYVDNSMKTTDILNPKLFEVANSRMLVYKDKKRVNVKKYY